MNNSSKNGGNSNGEGQGLAYRILTLNTLAFIICFAAWMVYGVLVTFLVDHRIMHWDRAQVGWLIGTPVLTGALMRLPLGVLTDRFGGRLVFSLLMVICAIPMYMVSYADTYSDFLIAGLCFGTVGASFAVGVAYTSVWFPPKRQGMALGIFGMGNLGAAITSMGAPTLLNIATLGGSEADGWRLLPKIYAGCLVVSGILFWLLTKTRKQTQSISLAQRLAPLRHVQVWRFGLYYFFFFGGFVALAQWLIPYFVNVYGMSVAGAGLFASIFSLPSGAIRALGGWASDKWGARSVLYVSFTGSLMALLLLFPPRMEVQSPGEGIVAKRPGTVMLVSEAEIRIGDDLYPLDVDNSEALATEIHLGIPRSEGNVTIFPRARFSRHAIVSVGDSVSKGQLIASAITTISFQAHRSVFTGLVLIVAILFGIGNGAVYKHIPTYFPNSVGVVGGIVGVLGGLGGFFNPIVFGYLLGFTGIWTTCWMFLFLVGSIALLWMHLVIRRMMKEKAASLIHHVEEAPVG